MFICIFHIVKDYGIDLVSQPANLCDMVIENAVKYFVCLVHLELTPNKLHDVFQRGPEFCLVTIYRSFSRDVITF